VKVRISNFYTICSHKFSQRLTLRKPSHFPNRGVPIDITNRRLRLRVFHTVFPHGKLLALLFYYLEEDSGKTQTVVFILANAFLYTKEWRCVSRQSSTCRHRHHYCGAASFYAAPAKIFDAAKPSADPAPARTLLYSRPIFENKQKFT
jgi:hypothetical protein